MRKTKGSLSSPTAWRTIHTRFIIWITCQKNLSMNWLWFVTTKLLQFPGERMQRRCKMRTTPRSVTTARSLTSLTATGHLGQYPRKQAPAGATHSRMRYGHSHPSLSPVWIACRAIGDVSWTFCFPYGLSTQSTHGARTPINLGCGHMPATPCKGLHFALRYPHFERWGIWSGALCYWSTLIVCFVPNCWMYCWM